VLPIAGGMVLATGQRCGLRCQLAELLLAFVCEIVKSQKARIVPTSSEDQPRSAHATMALLNRVKQPAIQSQMTVLGAPAMMNIPHNQEVRARLHIIRARS
jgi:hypothetical protein